MHTLFLVLFIVTLSSCYLGAAGFIGTRFYRTRREIHGCVRGGYCSLDHEMPAFFVGLFWIIALPAIGGMVIGGGNSNRPRLSRTDRRRAEELAEAEHQTALARERERAAQALDRQERALGLGSVQ